jgi:hypothetical protein
MRQTRSVNRMLAGSLLVVAATFALLFVGLELTERESSDDAVAGGSEPAVIARIAGSPLSRVTLSSSAALRIGAKTAAVRGTRGRKVVPYSAVLYDERGRTWVYTSPSPLAFVRAPVSVQAIRGDVAVLSTGPPVGTDVATVGVAELFGAEFEVDH